MGYIGILYDKSQLRSRTDGLGKPKHTNATYQKMLLCKANLTTETGNLFFSRPKSRCKHNKLGLQLSLITTITKTKHVTKKRANWTNENNDVNTLLGQNVGILVTELMVNGGPSSNSWREALSHRHSTNCHCVKFFFGPLRTIFQSSLASPVANARVGTLGLRGRAPTCNLSENPPSNTCFTWEIINQLNQASFTNCLASCLMVTNA